MLGIGGHELKVGGNADLVVLDEVNYAIHFEMLEPEKLLKLIPKKKIIKIVKLKYNLYLVNGIIKSLNN